MATHDIVGMKELNIKVSKIERSLDRIAKALDAQTKILNRQYPGKLSDPLKKEEDDEEDEK